VNAGFLSLVQMYMLNVYSCITLVVNFFFRFCTHIVYLVMLFEPSNLRRHCPLLIYLCVCVHILSLCLGLVVARRHHLGVEGVQRWFAATVGSRRWLFCWPVQAFQEASPRPQTDRASRLQPLSVWKSSCIIQLPQSEVQPLLSDCSLAEFVFNHCNLRTLLPWLP